MKALWRLLPYARPHHRDLTVALVALAVGVAFEVLRPWPTKILVDQILDHRPPPAPLAGLLPVLPGGEDARGLLLWVAISTVLIFLGGTVASMVSAVASVRLGQRMVYDLGADLFMHLQRLSLLFHSRRPVGDTIARVTGDPYAVQKLVTGVLLPLVQSAATLVSMFVVMWRLEPVMTGLAMGVAPFLVLSIRLFGGPMRQRTRERLDLEGRMMSTVEEALTSIPAVQAFTREDLEHARFRRSAEATVAAYERATRADMWFKLFVGFVTAVGTAAMIWIGGRYALDGTITVGTVLVFLSYLASLYGPLSAMTYTTATLQYAAANAERVMEILDTPADVREAPDARDVPLRGHVRYEGVGFGYDQERPVLRDVSLEVRPGELVAIVGSTGAGKTTLVNLLARFFDPWSGRVLIDGHDIRSLRVRSLRRQVALVLQDPFILPITVAENIAYGRTDATHEEIVAAATAANAAQFIEQLGPDGYQTVVGERGMTLSGGEKQRLSLARAFLKNAPILILDEPTSALDTRTETLLVDALRRLMQGRTTLIIAHRLSTIRNADRILVLDHGRIVEQGRHEDLLAGDGVYAGLFRAQFARPDTPDLAGRA